ncbi:hypothetical protein GCM10009118_15020 [Wandonia haliotis]|uniref:Methylmalonyl-CoA mutase alpha/beta chain catalytic domain-containing protein n=2 Tax=Wandonia haliotis TaxID=574963 RepID=A0ABN1MP55_9FLAO
MVDMKELLHATFPDTDRERWLKQLEKDLKGIAVQDALEFEDPIEEIGFKSYFHWSEKLADTKQTAFNSTRSFKTNNDWIIYQETAIQDTKKANKAILDNLMMGCNGIGFPSSNDYSSILNEVQLEYIYSDFNIASPEEMNAILALLPEQRDVTFSFDPLTAGEPEKIVPSFRQCADMQNVRAFEIDNTVFASAGANITQQLAIVCSQVKTYFELLTEAGENPDQIADKLQIKTGIGSNYVFEIAKFRALRLLLDNILEAYGVTAGKQIRLKAQSLFLNKSLEDPYTNLLRMTTEGMSAAIGGVDILHLQPYDTWSETGPGFFSYRMANNISNILKEESFFDKVSDAAGGTFAIEAATDILSDAAWELFRKIESEGGFLKATDFIHSEIERVAKTRIELLKNKTNKLIGINIFPNPDATSLIWKVPANSPEPLILELHKEGGDA